MFSALIKGIQQLSDPKARQVVWMAFGVAILAILVLWVVVAEVLAKTAIFETPWLEGISDFLGGALTLVLSWLLFPSAISAVIGLLLERIAGAVEARHYPHLPAANDLSLTEALIEAAKFLGLMVALNILLLPFLFIPPLFAFVFYGVNGYLLGREFFELVATRRMSVENARALRKSRQGTVIAVGVIFAMLMTVPIVNLLTPVVATATMLHLFEDWRREGGYALTTT
jgi:CysZ protein